MHGVHRTALAQLHLSFIHGWNLVALLSAPLGSLCPTVSANIPSMSKQTLKGTSVNSQQTLALSVSAQANQGGTSSTDITTGNITEVTQEEANTYNLLERLYSTTWVSVESGWDDGQPETEETYIFFNSDSEMVEREYENGILDGRDDYSTLQWISDIQVSADVGAGTTVEGTMPLPVAGTDESRNACIVQNKEKGDNDTDYEIYFMTGAGDNRVLYVVDGDNRNEAVQEFKELLAGLANGRTYADNRYVLAKEAK